MKTPYIIVSYYQQPNNNIYPKELDDNKAKWKNVEYVEFKDRLGTKDMQMSSIIIEPLKWHLIKNRFGGNTDDVIVYFVQKHKAKVIEMFSVFESKNKVKLNTVEFWNKFHSEEVYFEERKKVSEANS